jgi:lipopolysaccharide transport system ATP-binding protein
MTVDISVENISKIYHLGQIGTGTFTNDMKVWWARARGKPNPLLKIGQTDHGNLDGEEIWALRDINFTVEQGEVLGIIGRNGAGKSTLLKILSRVTAPTSGKIKVKGRIASLLEVGTGFHPDLTGRENIYLNGAILGMTRKEVLRKLDEIVAFAEIEQFLDTPVKRYSSGMYVRLAFAVAAHLDPEILVVDEVLAVGDAEFQKKCLGKMGDVANEGRTVLFVSHNMQAMVRLCKEGIWLHQGTLRTRGTILETIGKYMQSGLGMTAEKNWPNPKNAPGDDNARLKSIRVISDGKKSDTIDIRLPLTIEMEYWNLKPGAFLLAGLSFVNDLGQIAFVAANLDEKDWMANPLKAGLYRYRCVIPGNLLSEGRFSIVAEVSTRYPMYQIHFLEYDSVIFQVIDTGEPGSVRAGWGRPIPGVVRPKFDMQNEYLEKNGIL